MFDSNNMNGVSVLSYSLLNSAADIIKENTFEKEDTDNYQFVNDIGDIYFPVSSKLSFHSGGDSVKIPTFYEDRENDSMQMVEYSEFITNYISDDIVTIEYNKSIHLPTLLKQLSENDKIYGAIVQTEGYMVNPLHPMVAFSIMSGLLELPEEANLHVFEWSKKAIDEQKKSDWADKQEFYEKEFSLLFDSMAHLIKAPASIRQSANLREEDADTLLKSPLMEDIDIKIRLSQTDTSSSESDKIKSVMIPTQLAISDIATPYYGMMYLEKRDGREFKGYNFTPMLSGNLQQTGSRTKSFNELLSNTSSGNICTGSKSPHTPRGWSTLSKININSMFCQFIVDINSTIPFVDSSKKISGAIWSGIERQSLNKLEELEKAEEMEETEETDG